MGEEGTVKDQSAEVRLSLTTFVAIVTEGIAIMGKYSRM